MDWNTEISEVVGTNATSGMEYYKRVAYRLAQTLELQVPPSKAAENPEETEALVTNITKVCKIVVTKGKFDPTGASWIYVYI